MTIKKLSTLIAMVVSFSAFAGLQPSSTFSSSNNSIFIVSSTVTNNFNVGSNYDFALNTSLLPTTNTLASTNWVINNFAPIGSITNPFTLSSSNGSIDISKTSQSGITNYDLSVDPSITNALASTNWVFSNATRIVTEQGYTMPVAFSSGGTNFYWIDFSHPYIYATMTANATTVFIGVTNGFEWALLSFNVVASGNQIIDVPDSFPHFNTNGWTHSAPYYSLTLTNGNELRMTVQSNITLSTTWQTYGQ